MAALSRWQLDAASRTPLHAQLVSLIVAGIREGVFKPGDKLPSERELMMAAHVSRATVRQALAALVHQGLLEKVHGSGTYVAFSKYEQPLHSVYSFSEQMRVAGQELVDTLLRKAVISADLLLAGRLGISEGDQVIYIRRLRSVQGGPIMLNNAYIPLRFMPQLAREDLNGSLYRVLTERYHQPILRATDRLEAVNADRTIAGLLGVAPGAALMYIERTAYTLGDAILHVGENYIRGDSCRFRTDLYADKVTALEVKMDLEDSGSGA